MWQLPAIQIGDTAVQLPCSVDSLIKLSNLAVRSQLDPNQAMSEFGDLFRSSPGLFLYAASMASEGDVADFGSWVLNEFLILFQKESLSPWNTSSSCFRVNKFRRAVSATSKATKPGAYLEGLTDFLKSLRLRVGKRTRSQFLQEMNVRRRIKPFLQRSSTGKKVKRKDWLNPTIEVEQLFAASSVVQQLRHSADQALQTAKLLAMKQLAYGASHEINNPLANIATRAQTLLADETHPERRRKLAVMYEQAMRAHEMISDLMLFGHPAKPKLETVELDELVKDLIVELKPELRRNKVKINLATYPRLVPVVADRTQLGDAIKALIRNALESLTCANADQEAAIQLRVWADEQEQVCLSVLDNGPGVTEDAAKHLFDPFYSGREAGRGLGFGLSKAWTIVERLHHGQLRWISHGSSTSFSTEFRITLPIRQPSELESEKDCQPHAA